MRHLGRLTKHGALMDHICYFRSTTFLEEVNIPDDLLIAKYPIEVFSLQIATTDGLMTLCLVGQIIGIGPTLRSMASIKCGCGNLHYEILPDYR
jgi:hypothetical protein